MSKAVVIGPGDRFLSGLSYYTWRLSSTLSATPILFRDMLPTFLFPGRDRVGKVESKIKYVGEPVMLDWWNPITWMRAVRECRRHDIVVLEWWTCSVAHMYAFISLFCGRKVVVEVHETIDPLESKIWPLRVYARVMKKIVWGRADAIVVHSGADFNQLLSKYREKIIIIPHGVYDQYEDHECYPSYPYFTVIFFGLVREYKGVKFLIEGFKKANIPLSFLYIQGEQWDELPAEKPPIYQFDFYADEPQIEAIFSVADVIVLPYLRASSSGVAHIAMHYGLPIIATKVGGLAELDDYEGMLYVPPADSEAIADRLKFVHEHWRGKRFPVPKRLEWSEIKKEWDSLFSLV
jgi:glycosyltransferase involved in cell wall biosynthesis